MYTSGGAALFAPAASVPACPIPGRVYTGVPVASLHLDPVRLQYKMNTNRDGVTATLSEVTRWDVYLGGTLIAWRDPADGKDYVCDGHHRLDLCRRLGVREVSVLWIEAADAREARAISARINIGQGHGNAVEAARFLRDAGVSVESLREHGISLKNRVTADAVVLARLGSGAFARLLTGRLSEAVALAVARHLGDHARQDELINLLDRQRREISLRVVEEMARELASTPTRQAPRRTLFGVEAESLFVQRCEVKAHVRAELRRDASDYAAVSSARRAERVSAAGNVLVVDANKANADRAARLLDLFDRLASLTGPIAAAIDEATRQYAEAGTSRGREAIKAKALAHVRQALLVELGEAVEVPPRRRTAQREKARRERVAVATTSAADLILAHMARLPAPAVEALGAEMAEAKARLQALEPLAALIAAAQARGQAAPAPAAAPSTNAAPPVPAKRKPGRPKGKASKAYVSKARQEHMRHMASMREAAARHIAAHGPSGTDALAGPLGCKPRAVYHCLRRSPWFTRDADGRYALTDEGRQAVRGQRDEAAQAAPAPRAAPREETADTVDDREHRRAVDRLRKVAVLWLDDQGEAKKGAEIARRLEQPLTLTLELLNHEWFVTVPGGGWTVSAKGRLEVLGVDEDADEDNLGDEGAE